MQAPRLYFIFIQPLMMAVCVQMCKDMSVISIKTMKNENV